MDCKFCGKAFDEKEQTCPHCGKAVEADRAELMDAMPELHDELDAIDELQEKTKRRRRRAIAVLLVIFLCIAAGWGAMYYFKMKTSTAEPTAGEAEMPVSSGVPGSAVEKFMDAGFANFVITDEASAQTALESVKADFGITSEKVSFRLLNKITVGGDTYYRFLQTYGNVDVYGAEVVVMATADGTPAALYGTCIGIDGLDLTAGLDRGKASGAIAEYVNSLDETHRMNEGVSVTEPQKIVCNRGTTTYLAYFSNISGYNENGEYIAYDAFVDADSGVGIFASHTASYEKQVETTPETPEKAAEETPVEPKTEPLREANVAAYTVNDKFNWNDKTKTSALEKIDTSEIRAGGVSSYLVDTVRALDKSYTYFDKQFAWKGLNGRDGEFSVYFNANDYVAECLPPENALYRDGALMFIQPKLAEAKADANVVTHEYAHGVMDYIARLCGTTAKTENAAIAEGFADVFAELAEGSAPDWKHGARNLAEPGEGYFKTLPGTAVFTDISDCYKYSTVVSHAAYQMHANGVTADAISELYFRTLCMLAKTSDFSDWRALTEFSAKKMVDAGTLSAEQFNSVLAAMKQTEIKSERYFKAEVGELAEDEPESDAGESAASSAPTISERTIE